MKDSPALFKKWSAFALLGGCVLLTACPAQLAWEEGQRNECKRRKSLARRCWSYGLISNIQCQQEETDELDRAARGDFTPADKSPLRVTDLSCDKDILVTYAYCDSLIPDRCRLQEASSSSSSSSSSNSSTARAGPCKPRKPAEPPGPDSC